MPSSAFIDRSGRRTPRAGWRRGTAGRRRDSDPARNTRRVGIESFADHAVPNRRRKWPAPGEERRLRNEAEKQALGGQHRVSRRIRDRFMRRSHLPPLAWLQRGAQFAQCAQRAAQFVAGIQAQAARVTPGPRPAPSSRTCGRRGSARAAPCGGRPDSAPPRAIADPADGGSTVEMLTAHRGLAREGRKRNRRRLARQELEDRAIAGGDRERPQLHFRRGREVAEAASKLPAERLDACRCCIHASEATRDRRYCQRY